MSRRLSQSTAASIYCAVAHPRNLMHCMVGESLLRHQYRT